MKSRGIIEHLALFGRELRTRSVFVSVRDEIDGAEALTLIDLFDRDEVYRALRTTFKVQHRDWATFEELFEQWWSGLSPVSSRTEKQRPAADGGHRVHGHRQSLERLH